MKCTMCDFRRGYNKREKIALMDISGAIFSDNYDQQQLDIMTGELSLEKSLCPVSYTLAITVSGVEPNGDITVVTNAKIPTKICPNCGKMLK